MLFEAHKIAFMGTGQMATALAKGFVRQLLRPSQIAGYDPSQAARERFAEAITEGVTLADHPEGAVAGATIVILAVKPQVIAEVFGQIRSLIRDTQLVVSVAAGITLERLSQSLPGATRLIRVMPNTPCLIGMGACGVSPAKSALPEDLETLTALLQTVGIVEVLPEHLLDAVTGLSGSGPAYAFQIIEALSDGGVRMGLPRITATRLAAQTLAGAATMLLQTRQHPGELKDAVTSPGGTTIAGLHALERGGLRAALMDAVQAATIRSQELGK